MAVAVAIFTFYSQLHLPLQLRLPQLVLIFVDTPFSCVCLCFQFHVWMKWKQDLCWKWNPWDFIRKTLHCVPPFFLTHLGMPLVNPKKWLFPAGNILAKWVCQKCIVCRNCGEHKFIGRHELVESYLPVIKCDACSVDALYNEVPLNIRTHTAAKPGKCFLRSFFNSKVIPPVENRPL